MPLYKYQKMPRDVRHEILKYKYMRDESLPPYKRITFRGSRRMGSPYCFLLFIEPTGEAVLRSASQATECTLEETRMMVLAAINVAKKHGAKTIDLIDNYRIKTSSGATFSLANIQFLTTGKTWYQSIIPSIECCSGYSTIIGFPENKKHAESNIWAEVASHMPPDMVIPIDISDIDINAPGSAMAVLDRIKHMDLHAEFFAKYEPHIIIASRVFSLSYSEWRININ